MGRSEEDLTTSIATGVNGLDKVLSGGFPIGLVSLIRGASGTGKTMFSIVFASPDKASDEKTIFATFDESPQQLTQHFKAWGRSEPAIFLDFRLDPGTEIAGDGVELGGLIIRIQNAIGKTGAKRLVLDGFDVLVSTFGDTARIRRDLNQLFEWCKQQDLTVLVTAGEEAGYRPARGPIDYAADCVIYLDQRMEAGLMTRMLRVIKCRGRGHGTNEYPYLIDSYGISLLPVTDSEMNGAAPNKLIRTGIDWLDEMLGGKGYWVGSAVMISGQSGTGKSLIAATMVDAACRAGFKVFFNSFEESPEAIVRNVKSIGIDLGTHMEKGSLDMISRRSVESGLEEHIIRIANSIRDRKPDLVVLDPVSALLDIGDPRTFKNAVLRLFVMLNNLGVTTVATELVPDNADGDSSLNISSLVDTWIRLDRIDNDGSMERLIFVQKSRGSPTSDQVERFAISKNGFKLLPSSKTGASPRAPSKKHAAPRKRDK